MLLRIIEFFGHEEHTKFLLNYGSVKDNRYHGIKKKSFAEMVNPKLHELAVPEALDLVAKLLTFDPVQRISAKEALNHPFFKLPSAN